MANPQDIPQLLNELYEMSKAYLRQETVEPLKRLGRQAGLGIGGALVMSLGGFLLVWGMYHGLQMALPVGEWWVVLARGLTGIGALLLAGIIIWRMQSDH